MVILKLKNSHKRESIEILVNSLFKYFLFLILLNNCSLDTKSGIWTDKKDLIVEKDKVIQILTQDELQEKVFNENLEIKLTSKLTNSSFSNNLTNNQGRINFNGELKKYQSLNFLKLIILNTMSQNLFLNQVI